MKLNTNGPIAKTIRFSLNHNPVRHNNLCSLFWTFVFAVLVVPLAAFSHFIGLFVLPVKEENEIGIPFANGSALFGLVVVGLVSLHSLTIMPTNILIATIIVLTVAVVLPMLVLFWPQTFNIISFIAAYVGSWYYQLCPLIEWTEKE